VKRLSSERSEILISNLTTLGLTKSEARAYLAVVKLGPSRTTEIAREASLQRTEIYRLMSRLVSMGLVEETLDKPLRYRASNPEINIPSLADRTVKQVGRAAAAAGRIVAKLTLTRSTARPPAETEVRVITGRRNLESQFLDALKSVEKEVWMMAAPEHLVQAKRSTITAFLSTISSKHVKARLITELDDRTIGLLRRQLRFVEIRHCEDVPSHLYGFDDRAVGVGLTTAMARNAGRMSEVLVTHPECVEVFRRFFEAFWDQAVPYEVWNATRNQSPHTLARRTVIWGRERLYRAVADWHLKAKERILDYMPTENGPVRVTRHLGTSFVEARNRGVRLQSLCHISRANLDAVQELCKVSEVRHTDASPLIGISVLDESEAIIQYIQTDTTEEKCPTDIAIYVTDREAVRRLGETFNLFWNYSTPAETRIQELSHNQGKQAIT